MIPHNKTPTFLGITYDTQLNFEKHVNTVVKKMEQRSGLLARLKGVDWGWARESMRTIYSATQRSLAEYAAPTWAPWISKTNQMKIERAQLRSARMITRNLRTPGGVVLQEAGLEEVRMRMETASAVIYDK